MVLIGETVTTEESATETLGRALGEAMLGAIGWPLVVSLHGDLGSGKTVLARGILRALGVEGAVRSPTFTLAIPYRGRRPVTHVDLYRLETVAAVEMLEWEDWLDGGGVLVVEWGERANHLLGTDRLEVALEHRGETERAVRAEATGAAASELGEALRAAWRRATAETR